MTEEKKLDFKYQFISADTTEFYADSVEWCPFGSLSNYFACGTYQLDEKETASDGSQTRQGNITLYKLSTLDNNSTEDFSLLAADVVPSSGILDMKWCPKLINNSPMLAVGCSDGKLLLLKLHDGDNKVVLSHVMNQYLTTKEQKILLSLDWSCENQGVNNIIASDNKGFLNYFQMKESELCLSKSWNAHCFESWIAAFNYLHSEIVFSGGDDCILKCWDLRNLHSPVFTSKRHRMGVTAISKSKLNECLLATGSYDENIFLWDLRSVKKPLSEISVHGGVWRLKWHPSNPEYLLSASMHNGFHILSVTNNKLELALSYDKHESLAYGVDWYALQTNSTEYKQEQNLDFKMKKNNIKNIIASCSFYDKLLHIWGINF